MWIVLFVWMHLISSENPFRICNYPSEQNTKKKKYCIFLCVFPFYLILQLSVFWSHQNESDNQQTQDTMWHISFLFFRLILNIHSAKYNIIVSSFVMRYILSLLFIFFGSERNRNSCFAVHIFFVAFEEF